MKKITAMLLIFIFSLMLSSCAVETNEDRGAVYTLGSTIDYTRAMLVLPSGKLIDGSLDGYFYNPETKNIYVNVQIDGVWYCTHPLNLTLIGE